MHHQYKIDYSDAHDFILCARLLFEFCLPSKIPVFNASLSRLTRGGGIRNTDRK